MCINRPPPPLLRRNNEGLIVGAPFYFPLLEYNNVYFAHLPLHCCYSQQISESLVMSFMSKLQEERSFEASASLPSMYKQI